MNKLPSIAIFDVGKTNKKLLLFDEQYKVVHEESVQLEETSDEDGFACEDVNALTKWIKNSFDAINKDERFDVKAVNFSAYGASFVYIDKNGKVLTPLYNYLRPYPQKLQQQFYAKYGGESLISKQTASPVLGSLNSGMQLYRLKYEHPEIFTQVAYALHLPQYLNFILAGSPATDITSVGCHTNLWDFKKNKYHQWVSEENIENCFAPVFPATSAANFDYDNKNYVAGYGLHDSSAALIPYLASFSEPFILLSTGTWCISLNPFNHTLLTDIELQQDCLCYLTYEGKPVKASRLFAGNEHEQQVNRIASYFNQLKEKYFSLHTDTNIFDSLKRNATRRKLINYENYQLNSFAQRDLGEFQNDIEAYYQLITDLVIVQAASTHLVLPDTSVKRIFVDGGFSKNVIYMHLLAKVFPGIEVYAATVAQASSLGAALAIHEHWNKNSLPQDLIQLKQYSAKKELAL